MRGLVFKILKERGREKERDGRWRVEEREREGGGSKGKRKGSDGTKLFLRL